MVAVKSSARLLWIVSLFIAIVMVTGQDNRVSSYMCERPGLRSVSCSNGQVIEPEYAFWGRSNGSDLCVTPSVTRMEDCYQENTYSTFEELCDGRQFCDFEAVSAVWGDVCPHVHKFLYLTYTCVDCVNKHGDDNQCDMWWRQGECGGDNFDWMSLNCKKSCSRCGDYTPAMINQHNNTACDIWAENGECRINPSYMLTYCRESCLAPVTKTSCARNRHDDDIKSRDCQRWADEGQCQINNHYMFWDCTKSCFGCFDDDKVRCTNKYFNETACELWAANGDCDTDPGWMIPNCLKTCLGCEADPVCKNVEDDSDCAYWESIGECEYNAEWMHQYCWKSCIACTNAEDELTDCSVNAWDRDRDINADYCDARYNRGLCSTNSSTMLTECTKSCFGCDPQVDDRVRCENKAQYSSDCEFWADAGECELNPGFMITNCLKACIKCEIDPVCNNYVNDWDCEEWASQGECTANPVYMHQMCWSSCMKCDVDLKCVNTEYDIDCEYWMTFGGCGSDNVLQPRMMDVCTATCANCDPILHGVPSCYDSYNDCPSWGESNECVLNRLWMTHHCRKTCSHCDQPLAVIDTTTTTTTMSPASMVELGSDVTSTAGWYSQMNLFSEKRTLITPYTVTAAATGKLKAFRVRLVNNHTVDLELWRPDVGSTKYYRRVYKQTVQYDASFEAPQTPKVRVDDCVEVMENDRIGFTSYKSRAPIAVRSSVADAPVRYYFSPAKSGANKGSFLSVMFALEFGVGVIVEEGGTC